MKVPAITQDTIVGDVLACWPETAPLFVERHMYCVGCSLAPFETLAEVAAFYGLPLEDFLGALREKTRVPDGQA